MFKRIFAALSGLLLSACTAFGYFLANAPVKESEISIKKDIAYGPQDHQKLNIYKPNTPSNKTIIFYYGGGWKQGDKDDYLFIADTFVQQGYNVVIPNYGLYPDHVYPQFLRDCALAADWISTNLPSEQLFLMGHSAGAYNAAMIAINDEYLAPHSLNINDITAVIGIAGPYNFTPSSAKYKRIFNNLDDYSQMHVSSYINANAPPFLIMHGREDSTVSIRNSQKLAQDLRGVGVAVEEHYYNMGHYKIIGAFAKLIRDKYSLASDVLNYMKSYE